MLFVLEMSVFLSLGSRTPDPHLRKWLNGRPTRRASHPKLVLFLSQYFANLQPVNTKDRRAKQVIFSLLNFSPYLPIQT